MPTYLPAAMEVRELFEGLLGREVTVRPSAPLAPGPATPASIGVYVDDSLLITAVTCADLALSAHAAACLGMLPVSASLAAIADGALDEDLGDTFYEVLNIAASMFNVPGADHVRLHAMHPAGRDLPLDAQARALTLGRRLDLEVDVAGYGSGRLSLVLSPT